MYSKSSRAVLFKLLIITNNKLMIEASYFELEWFLLEVNRFYNYKKAKLYVNMTV